MQPTPPPPPAPVEFPVVIQGSGDAPTAQAVYQAQIALRKELRNQLDRLEDQRDEIAGELRSEEATAAERSGLEARLKETDGRISNLEQQISQADLAVAKAAAVPGAIVEPPPPLPDTTVMSEGVTAVSIVFTLFVLCPIAISYARRLWKRGSTVIAPIPREVTDRLEAMGQAVESIAVEVERIGEGQRFLTRVMSDQGRQLGQGAAQPIPVAQAAAQPVGRQESR
jgi:hypothetical protein